jgi:hypothetical protein
MTLHDRGLKAVATLAVHPTLGLADARDSPGGDWRFLLQASTPFGPALARSRPLLRACLMYGHLHRLSPLVLSCLLAAASGCAATFDGIAGFVSKPWQNSTEKMLNIKTPETVSRSWPNWPTRPKNANGTTRIGFRPS